MGQSSRLSPYTPQISWLWPQSKLPVQPKQGPNSLLLHHLLSQASPCLSQGALFILSPVGSGPGRCHYSHYDSHMETEIQGDEGVRPRFSSMAQKWPLTWGLLCRGWFAYSCGLSLPASKSRASNVYTCAWISFHGLVLGLPVNQLIDHLWAAPAYLALCWELQGVGQERREIGVGPGVSPHSLMLL